MKLILREYLSSLKERDELDAVLPDLLSQMGLNVYSRPQRGTRQDGVDIGTVGSLHGGEEKVYLFSLKPGNLTRRDWSSDSPQSLRPSLNQILDAYIPNRLPVEHRGKEIVICVAVGGDVQEQVRPEFIGFLSQNTKGKVTFEEWNGDKIASLILTHFLREDLLPPAARASFRKSLALLDEPDAAYRHFASLVNNLCSTIGVEDYQKITVLRQMNICLGILYSWANDVKNLESAYLAAEFTLLNSWSISRGYLDKDTKHALAIKETWASIFSLYQRISSQFLNDNVLPHVDKTHGISSAIRGSSSLDINLKLFDLLGRLAIDGIWSYWGSLVHPVDETEKIKAAEAETLVMMDALKNLIRTNPALFLPAKDDHVIDVSIALFLFGITNEHQSIRNWLSEMLGRCGFSYAVDRPYPTVFSSYSDLLLHPKSSDEEYRKRANSASVLYPTLALWASLIRANNIYEGLAKLQKETLPFCTFQFWHPDNRSETCMYQNNGEHGLAVADISLEQSMEQFLNEAFQECDRSPEYRELSAVRFGWWPLVLVACRHYRYPMPIHLLESLRHNLEQQKSAQNIV